MYLIYISRWLLEYPTLALGTVVEGYHAHRYAQIAVSYKQVDGFANAQLGLATAAGRQHQERQCQQPQPEEALPRTQAQARARAWAHRSAVVARHATGGLQIKRKAEGGTGKHFSQAT